MFRSVPGQKSAAAELTTSSLSEHSAHTQFWEKILDHEVTVFQKHFLGALCCDALVY